MNHFRFSPKAAQDLDDIIDYIVQRNPIAAAHVLRRIEQTCRKLAQFPGMGTERDDLQLGLRVFLSGNCVICYRDTGNGIEIARVVHGSRDIQALFSPP